MSRAEFHYDQPSRGSRLLIAVLSLAVLFLSAWILTPIVLANLGGVHGAGSEPRKAEARAVEPRGAEARSTDPRNGEARNTQMRDADPRPTASVPAATEPKDLVTANQPAEPRKDPEPEVVAARDEPASAPALASASPSVIGGSSAAQSPAAVASTVPWPTSVAAPPGELADDAEASATPDEFGPVPLPRKRPDPALAAKLAIPLPRPRPDGAGGEMAAPAEPGIDALIERTSRVE